MDNRAILIVNHGSPDSTAIKDVKKYLHEFLMDERVIDIPKIFRTVLVKGIIVPFRVRRSAKKYKLIWTQNGAPLIKITESLANKLQKETELPVYFCMRYGNPGAQEVLTKIVKELPNIKELIFIPLYPHYAMSSYETVVEYVKRAWKNGAFNFNLKIVKPFYEHSAYIKAQAELISTFLNDDFDHILFSYHGVPERHIRKTDITKNHCLNGKDCCSQISVVHDICYRHQVLKTTHLLSEALDLNENMFSVSFQSRLGLDKWLEPSTSKTLKILALRGVKKLLVVAPSFVGDCLETIEELDIEGKNIFLNAGGTDYKTLPCLNDNNEWVKALNSIINDAKLTYTI